MSATASDFAVVATRKRVILVGLLFLVATITFMTADMLIVGVLDRKDFLMSGSAHTNALAAGALLAFIQGVAIVGIAVALYPLFKRHSEPLALAYVGLRVGELAATLIYMAAPLLIIHFASGLADGTISGSASQLGGLFQGIHSASVSLIYLVTSVLGTILSYLLYRTVLVPRAIAILGLIGYPALMIGGILALFNVSEVTEGTGLIALIPGGLFELILPIWLIAKGFNRPATEPAPEIPATGAAPAPAAG